MSKVVGIDLGTTNSCVAVMEGGRATVIANADGFRTTPSMVAYTKDGDQLIGRMARRQAVTNPENTFYSVKRFVGCRADEIAEELKAVAYQVKRSGDSVRLACPILGKDFAPEEVSARVLRKLADDASAHLGEKVTRAVVTVPAYFNDSQRRATKDAGRIAGLEVMRIINEPTAAALAYGVEKGDELAYGMEEESDELAYGEDEKGDKKILVFDLGGGTFDVSILTVGDDNVFEVIATGGDPHLGGDDFDKAVVDYLVDTFKAKEGIDLRKDKQALQRLTEAAEKAKIELSSATQSEINLPFIAGQKGLEESLTRSKFEELCAQLVARCKVPVENVLKEADLSYGTINEVVMVGGSTRIPAIKTLVKKLTGKNPNQSVNPDEVVALGAAIQGGAMTGDAKDVLLLDVTSLPLGTEVFDGPGRPLRMSTIIEKNTKIPTTSTETYFTVQDNQTKVKVNVLQGEHELAKDNKLLGEFLLEDIPPKPAGIAKIEVTFDIDANSILNVTAQETTTGKQASISITGSSNLTERQIEQMARDMEDDSIVAL